LRQLAFDENTGRQLEALYGIADAVLRRRLVREALKASPGERVLDVGCGPGFYCAEVREEVGPAGSVLGIDGSAQMLALAERRCEGHYNVELREGVATTLPVPDASFDAALCVQVLEYVHEPANALAELHRVLRPGGRVLVWDTDWATVSWHSAEPARMQRVLSAWDEHLAHPSLPRRLAPAMRRAGFEEVRSAAHAFASTALDPETFGTSLISLIESFVPGRNGVGEADVNAWTAEQRELGERGEYFFSYTQFCFTGRRGDES
jgi:arsenite methyltransferase